MLKNIFYSVLIIAAVCVGGYYFFTSPKEDLNIENLGIDNYGYNNASTTGEFGEIVTPAEEEVVNTNNKKSNMITIETNHGKIVIETYNSDAPNTVNNFITLANKGYYNGLTFHRVIKGFMIQGGDPNGNGTGGPGYQFADELNPSTTSYKAGYKQGVVAMANAGPNTNGSQFFIMHQDYPLPNNYTIFGKVVSGQEVVDKIANVQVGANDKPVTPVIMKTVSVE
ncbi:MAG: peptidylprolyl isomerase [Patescibacteria group bacterium]